MLLLTAVKVIQEMIMNKQDVHQHVQSHLLDAACASTELHQYVVLVYWYAYVQKCVTV